MKEVIRASVAGIGFVFDEDAFGVLEKYIDSVTAAYAANPDGPEIVADIEARVVELILTRQSVDTVVVRKTVEEIVEQLGLPDEETVTEGAGTLPEPTAEVFPRRLYRDLENSKLGGVCSGIARYFDTDPALVRIGMSIPLMLIIVLPSIGFHRLNAFLGSLIGVFFLMYFLMWFMIPAARTPRQKLEMQGRRITAGDIEREISVGKVGRDGATSKDGRSAVVRLVELVGNILLFFVKFVLVIVGISLALVTMTMFVAIIGLAFNASWVGIDPSWIADGIHLTLGGMPITTTAFAAMILGVILLPMAMLVYQIIRFVFRARNSRTLMWILGGAWLLLVAFTTVVAFANLDEIRGPAARGWFEQGLIVDEDEGWLIYERNVQEYRDSVDRAKALTIDQSLSDTIPQIYDGNNL